MDEIVKEFLIESHENLNQLDRDLVALEKDPGSPELLGSVFRTIPRSREYLASSGSKSSERSPIRVKTCSASYATKS
jgi:chemotaxis protein histidine kinase CheA